MTAFKKFATYYDLIHAKKEYNAETSYIHNLIRKFSPHSNTIMDVGCGTGNYAFELARRGFEVTGIDSSHDMLAIAKAKMEQAQPSPPIKFIASSIEEFNSTEQYGIISCLFNVLCYLTEGALLATSLLKFKSLLINNGVLIFDFWNQKGVLSKEPSMRIQRFKSDEVNITRLVEPKLLKNQSLVEVHYTFFIEEKSGHISCFKELHHVKFFKPIEIRKLLQEAGFRILLMEGWMTNDKLVDDWTGIIVAQKN